MIALSDMSRQHQLIWKLLCDAASKDERCPTNEELRIALAVRQVPHGGKPMAQLVGDLAKQAHLRIEVCGHNWRTVHILTGPFAGKSTKVHPLGYVAYLIIDHLGSTRIVENRAPVRF